MSKHVILHLSDLHISKFISKDNNHTYCSRAESQDYIENFCKKVNSIVESESFELDWLIITGDLANTANKKEYNNVKEFLLKIQKILSIEKEKILLIPGNHDIYRAKVQYCYEEDDSKAANTFFEEKLETYTNFFEEYTSMQFNHMDSVIFNKEDENNKILFLGINTLYKESHLKGDHIGYIDKDSLVNGLNKIKAENKNYDNLKKIILLHHPPEFLGVFEGSAIENWKQIKAVLNDYDIHIYIFGHIHSHHIDKYKSDIYLGTGSFALLATDITNTFSLYILEENQITARIYDFRADPLNGEAGVGDWKLYEEKSFNFEELETKQGIVEGKLECECTGDSVQNPFGTLSEEDEQAQVEIQTKSIEEDIKHNNVLSTNFINKVKEEFLFQSGHFHWGEDLKSHGWLNTNKMLSKFANVALSVNSILYYINKYDIDVDIVIGIGMEGNILGSILAINLGVKYTYVPSKEHSTYESDIDLSGSDKVLFVTDTIFTGNTINNILNKYKSELDKVTKKSLIGLFCLGDIDKIKETVNEEIDIYSICDEIKVNLCNRNPQDCPINKYGLDIIYKL